MRNPIKHLSQATVVGASALVIGCAQADRTAIPGMDRDARYGSAAASAEFINTDGEVIGTATVNSGFNGTLVRVEIDNLSEGDRYHAMHIHAVGDCSDPEDGFQASGGHVNPEGRDHGLMNLRGPDGGDFANLYAHEDGSVRQELFTTLATLDGNVGARILDRDGAALVIHENPDDHVTQPIGGAGARIACGVIER